MGTVSSNGKVRVYKMCEDKKDMDMGLRMAEVGCGLMRFADVIYYMTTTIFLLPLYFFTTCLFIVFHGNCWRDVYADVHKTHA